MSGRLSRMASISQEIVIEADAQDVWAVIGEFATGPSRMAPGFGVDTRPEDDCRVVTFADGTVVRERFVGVDHDARRIVYSIVGGSVVPEHDNASMQIVADGERRCRLLCGDAGWSEQRDVIQRRGAL